jgi:O-antigen/teichoic acid export membrane protein
MKRPLKNLGSLLVSDAGSRLIGFLVTAYLARVLAPSAFGVLNIGLAALGHLSILGSPGIQIVEARNVAAKRPGLLERTGGVITLRLLLACILLLLTWTVTVLAISSPAVRDVVRLYSASLIPYALLLDWPFQGREDFVRLGVSRLLTYVVFGAVAVLLVRSANDLVLAPVAFLAGNIVTALFLGIAFIRVIGRPALSWNPGLVRTILRDNFSVGVASFLAQVVSNFPPLVVGYFLENRDVGIYSAALKLVFVFLIIDRLFGALFMPVVTRYVAERGEEVPFLLTVTTKVLLILLIPATLSGIALSRVAILLVFGDGYAEAAPLMQIMMVFAMVTVLNTLFVSTLIGSGREHDYSRSMIIGTAVLAITVVVLTPLFHTVGAAWALLAGELSTLILMVRGARAVTVLPSLRVFIRPGLACIAMAGVLWLLRSADQFVACAIALLAYGVVSLSLRSLSREELRYLRERFV